MTHLLRLAAVTGCITLCAVMPFLPGRHDSLAMPLSMMAQLFSAVGLLLVPIGALWLAAEHSSHHRRKRYAFSITALIAFSVVWLIVSLGAIFESLTLGLGVLAVGAYVVVRILRRLKPVTTAPPGAASAIPLYLVIVPIAATLAQFALADPLTEFSRSRAIRNSAPLIADIERYRATNGRYPASLVAVWPDYSPSVIGIKAYQYEPSGDAYNLLFEPFTFRLGTREIVVYNPREQQVMTSHAMDLLQLTPEELALEQTRGHYAVHDASQPKWKYFWFD